MVLHLVVVSHLASIFTPASGCITLPHSPPTLTPHTPTLTPHTDTHASNTPHTHTHTCATCSVLALSSTFRRCASFSSLAIARGEEWMSPLAFPWDCRGEGERDGEGTGRGWGGRGHTLYPCTVSTGKYVPSIPHNTHLHEALLCTTSRVWSS